LTYRARSLDPLVTYEDLYKAVTAAQIKECFQKYYIDEQTIRVLVKPDAAPPAPPTPAGPPAPKPPAGG
jgi:predicted Zn-dependent peptidase